MCPCIDLSDDIVSVVGDVKIAGGIEGHAIRASESSYSGRHSIAVVARNSVPRDGLNDRRRTQTAAAAREGCTVAAVGGRKHMQPGRERRRRKLGGPVTDWDCRQRSRAVE